VGVDMIACIFGNYLVIAKEERKGGNQMQESNQPRGSRDRWTNVGGGKGNLISILKNKKE